MEWDKQTTEVKEAFYSVKIKILPILVFVGKQVKNFSQNLCG